MPQDPGPRYKFEKLEFWAERGMITLVDTERAAANRPDAEKRISAADFMKRAIAARMHHPDMYPDKVAALRRLLEDATKACKLAKAQGDPMDPSVLEHVVKHQRRRRIVLPSELPAMPQAPPSKITVKDTPAETMTEGIEVKPSLIY
jgi:hypothetical protein